MLEKPGVPLVKEVLDFWEQLATDVRFF